MFYYFSLRHFYTAPLADGPHILTHQGRVWDFSPSLKARGMSLQLPLKTASHHCPDAKISAVDFTAYRSAQNVWLDWCLEWFNYVEPHYPHAWYARDDQDLPFGPVAEDFQQTFRQLLLTGTWGGGWSKLTARLAARRSGGLIITKENSPEFLKPIPLSWLAPQYSSALAELGLYNIGQLAAVSRRDLVHQFGAAGHKLYTWARGEDDEPFLAQTSEEVCWRYQHPWDLDELPNYQQLEVLLAAGCRQLALQGRQRHLDIKSLTLAGETAQGDKKNLTITLQTAGTDPQVLLERILPAANSLRLRSILLQVHTWEKHYPQQLDLFSRPAQAKPTKEQVITQLQRVLGSSCFKTVQIPRREKILALWEAEAL